MITSATTNNGVMDLINRATSWLCDMDGVLIHDDALIEGADQFLEKLQSSGRSFLLITNNSFFTARELSERLLSMGLDVPADHLWTSALATAQFIHDQRPGGSAFVIGELSVHEALYDVGYREQSTGADYVVLGETQNYSYEDITTAVRLLKGGSHLVATNPEPTGPSLDGDFPGVGAVAAMLEFASGVTPYFVGKPNAVMLCEGLARLAGHIETSILVGDRMETDILAGVEAGLTTVLVLSGVTRRDQIEQFPFRPSLVVDSVVELIDRL
jgi:NagD protein